MERYKKSSSSLDIDFEDTYKAIVQYIQQARKNIIKSVNIEQVIAYWHIGKTIVEKEQQGHTRS